MICGVVPKFPRVELFYLLFMEIEKRNSQYVGYQRHLAMHSLLSYKDKAILLVAKKIFGRNGHQIFLKINKRIAKSNSCNLSTILSSATFTLTEQDGVQPKQHSRFLHHLFSIFQIIIDSGSYPKNYFSEDSNSSLKGLFNQASFHVNPSSTSNNSNAGLERNVQFSGSLEEHILPSDHAVTTRENSWSGHELQENSNIENETAVCESGVKICTKNKESSTYEEDDIVIDDNHIGGGSAIPSELPGSLYSEDSTEFGACMLSSGKERQCSKPKKPRKRKSKKSLSSVSTGPLDLSTESKNCSETCIKSGQSEVVSGSRTCKSFDRLDQYQETLSPAELLLIQLSGEVLTLDSRAYSRLRAVYLQRAKRYDLKERFSVEDLPSVFNKLGQYFCMKYGQIDDPDSLVTAHKVN